jgi:hypothetical protein
VLLAVGISVLAMAAVYAALGIHLRFIDAGDADVLRAQLARAVLGRIAADVRATVFYGNVAGESSAAETEAESPDEAGSQADDSATAPEASSADADEGPTDESGLFGGRNVLALYVDRAGLNHGSSTDGSGVRASTHGLQLVSYYPGPAAASDESSAPGLVRHEADPMVTRVEDLDFESDGLPEGAQVMAPEAALLEFRYFDGFEWFDSWDSTYFGELPRAVEIAVGFTLTTTSTAQAQALEKERMAAQATGRVWPPVYRMVVALPMAEQPASIGSGEEDF